MMQKNAPTMKDVAKEAVVALGTVSRVINGASVRKTSKDKIDNDIRKLKIINSSFTFSCNIVLKTSTFYSIKLI